MKKNFFWSPHIDPQVATLRSVSNTLNYLNKYEKKSKNFLINVFGEWDEYNSKSVEKINLTNNKILKQKNSKDFFHSRLFIYQFFFFSYFPLKRILNNDKPNYLIVHLITSVPLLMFIMNKFETRLILRISGYPKLNFFRFFLWKFAANKIRYVICPTQETKSLLLKKNFCREPTYIYSRSNS